MRVWRKKKSVFDDKYEKADWNIGTQMIENEWIQVDGVSLAHHDYREADKKIKLGNNDKRMVIIPINPASSHLLVRKPPPPGYHLHRFAS